MKRIVILGNYGAGNFGDELILKGIVKALRGVERELTSRTHVNDALEIWATSANEKETERNHGIRAMPFLPSTKKSWIKLWVKSLVAGGRRRTRSVIAESDLIIFGGGCLFNETEEDSINIWAAQIELAHKWNKKIIILGQSFGVFKKPKNKETVRRICGKMNTIIVRDNISKQNLEALNVTQEITILPDPALWLTINDFKISEPQPAQNETLAAHASPRVPQGKYILINTRTWPTVNKNKLNKKIEQIVRQLAQPEQNDEQIECFQLLLNKNDKPDLNLPAVRGETLDDIMRLYRHAHAVIAMRLHGVVAALTAGIPVAPISYDDKVSGLCNYLGFGPAVIPVNELLSNSDTTTYERIVQSWEITSLLQDHMSVEQQKLIKAQNILTNILL